MRARAGTCDGCLRSVEEGEWVSECAPCAWYLCHRCQLQQCSQYSESETLEEMLQELFRLHDLNGNGALEEEELVQLNSKVAMLHHGRDSDLEAVKAKYRALFREKLDPLGRPVGYATFRGYVQQVLQGLDRNLTAQEMIVEQFVAEAGSARAAFRVPSFAESADGAFLSKLSLHSSLLIPSASEVNLHSNPMGGGIDPMSASTASRMSALPDGFRSAPAGAPPGPCAHPQTPQRHPPRQPPCPPVPQTQPLQQRGVPQSGAANAVLAARSRPEHRCASPRGPHATPPTLVAPPTELPRWAQPPPYPQVQRLQPRPHGMQWGCPAPGPHGGAEAKLQSVVGPAGGRGGRGRLGGA